MSSRPRLRSASPRDPSRRVRGATALLATGLLLTGCGTDGDAPGSIVRTSACAVSAPSGFSDAGTGAAVLDQVRIASHQGLVDTTSTQRVSTPAQTQAALERFSADGCTLTVLVGPGGAGALAQVAAEDPDRAFLAVATGIGEDRPDNVLSVDFDLRDSAFLAGYAAAHATTTGTVAVSASTGQADGEALLAAFDDGVEAAADAQDEDVRIVAAGMVDARTVEDTSAAGKDWAQAAIDEDADVLVPFGSASPQGVAEHLTTLAEEQEAAEDEQDGAPADEVDDAAADEADDAGSDDVTAEESADAGLPYLIWHGSDGSKTLPGPVRDRVIASIVPRVDLGMRAVLAGWPGDGGDPSALLEVDGESVDDDREAMPEVVGGLEVHSRRAVGDLENGGVELAVSDGILSQLTGLGRALADGRELLEDEDDSED